METVLIVAAIAIIFEAVFLTVAACGLAFWCVLDLQRHREDDLKRERVHHVGLMMFHQGEVKRYTEEIDRLLTTCGIEKRPNEPARVAHVPEGEEATLAPPNVVRDRIDSQREKAAEVKAKRDERPLGPSVDEAVLGADGFGQVESGIRALAEAP